MELWDVLDEYGNPTGKIVRRDEKLGENEFHLGVHVWIINSGNEILIQQRQSDRTFAPGMWAVHGGKAVSGETSLQASIRELKEELGICINPDNLEGPVRYERKSNHEFCDIYVLRQDISLKEIKLQKEEVKDIKWVTNAELQQMMRVNSFYQYSNEYFKCLSRYLNLSL